MAWMRLLDLGKGHGEPSSVMVFLCDGGCWKAVGVVLVQAASCCSAALRLVWGALRFWGRGGGFAGGEERGGDFCSREKWPYSRDRGGAAERGMWGRLSRAHRSARRMLDAALDAAPHTHGYSHIHLCLGPKPPMVLLCCCVMELEGTAWQLGRAAVQPTPGSQHTVP